MAIRAIGVAFADVSDREGYKAYIAEKRRSANTAGVSSHEGKV